MKKILLYIVIVFLLLMAPLIFFVLRNPAPPASNLTKNEADVNDDTLSADIMQAYSEAVNSASSSMCMDLPDKEISSDCVDMINLRLAIESNKLIECEKNNNEAYRKNCILSIIEKNQENFSCKGLNDKNLLLVCNSESAYFKAIKSADPDLCKEVTDNEKRANCYSELLGVDPLSDADSDGLVFAQEMINYTDPNKPDTDNDGYLDGQEVQSGNNPLVEIAGEIQDKTNLVSCDKIEDYNNRNLCDTQFKDHKMDIFACDKISVYELSKYCKERLDLYKKEIMNGTAVFRDR